MNEQEPGAGRLPELAAPGGALDTLVREGVRAVGAGAVWAVGDARGPLGGGAHGVLGQGPYALLAPGRRTLYDLASVTKVLALWPCAGVLWQDGLLPLDEPLGRWWAPAGGRRVGGVAIRQLMAHTAGLLPFTRFEKLYGPDPAAIRAGVLGAPLHREPGRAVEYTDRAAVLLAYIVEDLGGAGLDELAARWVWEPLGMTDTRYGPLAERELSRTAPTEREERAGGFLRGVVHDPSARLLGGVSGNAGAFSTSWDLGRFLTAVLDPPRGLGWGGDWTAESLRDQTGGLEPVRGLSWMVAPGTEAAEGTFVHYGFTGTGIWVSRELGRWAVLLTNKVHYDRNTGPLTDLRNAYRRAVFG
ncbi:serine hydrolase domain-containing protein [Kitasatospora sp. NPDC101183]|uniref:serine hydrolase domain-containing protein n=1 Tax=Kitasatospora sp. NPDC101183 TaxID=3364100 RepID=UPI003815097D